MGPADAQALHARARLGDDAAPFEALWTLADLDADGRLNRHQFCLFMAALKAAKKRGATPASLSLKQVGDVVLLYISGLVVRCAAEVARGQCASVLCRRTCEAYIQQMHSQPHQRAGSRHSCRWWSEMVLSGFSRMNTA